jgi:hypothetical protein
VAAGDFVAGFAVEQVRQRGVGGVERGEEVGGHGSAVGGKGLVFYGADFDDAGVVDENVDAAEVGDGVIDELGGLGGVGEIGGDEEDVVGGLDGFAIEQGVTGGDELFEVACGKDESGSSAGVAFGESEAETAGAAGDDDYLAGAQGRAGSEGVGCCCGCRGDAGKDLCGVQDSSGLLHSWIVRCTFKNSGVCLTDVYEEELDLRLKYRARG